MKGYDPKYRCCKLSTTDHNTRVFTGCDVVVAALFPRLKADLFVGHPWRNLTNNTAVPIEYYWYYTYMF